MFFRALRDARFFLSYRIPATEKDHLLRFVKDGERKANGEFETDPDTGLKMTGVIAWARAFRLFDVKFYLGQEIKIGEGGEEIPGDVVFVVTADRTMPADKPDDQPDWANIPGFVKLFGKNTKLLIQDDLNDLVVRP